MLFFGTFKLVHNETWKSAVVKEKKNSKNVRRGRELKFGFLRFMKKNYPNEKNGVTQKGLNAMAIPFVEDWLSAKINMFSLKHYDALKFDKKTKTIVPHLWRGTRKKCRAYVCERYSKNAEYTKVVNLLCKDQHVYCILNIEQQCKAYYCDFCNKKLERIDKFKDHKCRDNKVCYKSEKPVHLNTNMNHDLKSMDPRMTMENDLSFAYIAISQNELLEFELSTTIKKSSEAVVKLSQSFETIEQCGKFAINVLYHAAAEILEATLAKNVQNINILQQKVDGIANDCLLFGRNVTRLENDHVMKTKDKFMAFLSYVNVFVAGNELKLVDMLMNSLLLECVQKSGQKSVQTAFYKGKLARIQMKKNRLIFKCLNYISSILIDDNVKENGFATMNTLISGFQNEFGMNLCHLTTGAKVGVEILCSFLKPLDHFRLLSPTKFLSEQLENYSRYGLLTTSQHIIGDCLPLKSAIHMDYEKFYLSCISNLDIPTGIGIKYVKDDNKNFVCQTATRKRSVYANLFFAFLDTLLLPDITLLYNFSFGFEFRSGMKNKPVDGVLIFGGKKIVIEFEGCVWHLLCLVKEKLPCHYDAFSQPLGHQKTCRLCSNMKIHAKNPVFPKIFKFKAGETEKSRHPVIKQHTYEEVYMQDNDTKMSNFGPACEDVIFIKECDIGRLFDGSISEFFSYFGLAHLIKPDLKDLIFGTEMRKTCIRIFPLMRFHGKVTQKSFIKLLQFKTLNGFVNLSIKICEKKAKEKFGYVRPFAFRSAVGEKKVIYSWNIKNQTVPFNMVKYLLSKPDLKMQVLNVNWFVEYSSSQKLFGPLKSVAMKAMKNQKNNPVFTRFLKFALNASFGVLGQRNQGWGSTILADRKQVLSMNQMESFIGAIPVSDRFNWLHFKNFMPILNLSHVHLSLLSHAKVIMLEFIWNLKRFLEVEVALTNCDSVTIVSKKEIDLQTYNGSSLVLDQYLRHNFVSISQYIDWKKECFLQLGVCPLHLDQYKLMLQNQLKFEPLPCCLSYLNASEYPYKMKMEFCANKGLILGSTHFSLYNSHEKTEFIRSSGKLNPVFPLVKDCLPSQLHTLIN